MLTVDFLAVAAGFYLLYHYQLEVDGSTCELQYLLLASTPMFFHKPLLHSFAFRVALTVTTFASINFGCCCIAQQAGLETQLSSAAKSIRASLSSSTFKKLAICDLTDLDGTVQELGKYVAEELTVELLLEKGGFSIIDRANLARIFGEHKLGQSGLVKPEDIKKFGALSGADVLLVGTITEIQGQGQATLKLLAVESGELIGAARMKFALSDEHRALKQRTHSSTDPTGSTDGAQPARDKQFTAKKLKFVEDDLTFTLTGFVVGPADNKVTATVEVENASKSLAFAMAIDAQRDGVFGPLLYRSSVADSTGAKFAMIEGNGLAADTGFGGWTSDRMGSPALGTVNVDGFTKVRAQQSTSFSLTFAPGEGSMTSELDYSFRLDALLICVPFPTKGGQIHRFRRVDLQFSDIRPRR